MKLPLVSVCVVTYNHENYIRQCLEGILMQQTSFDFNIIIGEDCSTDGTRSIIREMESEHPDIIKPVYHQKNVGAQRNAYEFCFPRLNGKYVAICEGDDYWTDPLKLQKQVDFLDQHPECSFCFHRVGSVDQDGNTLKGDVSSDSVKQFDAKDVFHMSIPTLSVLFRNCIKTIPAEIMKVKSGDTFLFGLLARDGGAADLGFVGATYRKHPGGVYNQLSLFNQYKQTIYTRKIMKRSAAFNSEQKKEIAKEIVKRKVLYLKYFFRKNQIALGIQILFI